MDTAGLDPEATKARRARRMRKVALWVILGCIALVVFVSLLPKPPSKPAPVGFARSLVYDGATGVTAAFASAIPSGAQVPISEIRQPGNHAALQVYVWASGSDPVRASVRDIYRVLRWEVELAEFKNNAAATPLSTVFTIGYGKGHVFGRKGDRVYLTVAYTRKAVETNKAIWSGKSSKSKQFAAAVLNAASNVAMLQGRPETKQFCSHVPAASRFCALIEKSISFQNNLGSK